jgi:lipoate-protein ligase A
MNQQLQGSSKNSCEEWRLLKYESADPYENMAVEDAILSAVEKSESPNTLRLWRNRNSIVIGCYQSVDLEINHQAAMRTGVKVVRRFTGGGAVYHDFGNLNFSIFIHKPHRLIRDDLNVNFQMFSKWLIAALRNLQVTARFERNNSIFIGNQKISGMAAANKLHSFLLHGTLLVNTKIDVLNQVLKKSVRRKRRYVQSRWTEVANLSKYLAHPIKLEDIQNELLHAFQNEYHIKLNLDTLTSYEHDQCNLLYNNKYAQPEWNLKF